ncbi:MAG: bifunctional folylpolyglutamate synthase/dihydrofolate synthase [Firmicutes bacterium]|nr:bifunctional folylpolyglutamate synthase/dihydrofolate synthase [Bacillota bacterium]
MTYAEALAFLHGLLTHRPPGQPTGALKLDRMRALCALLGHPERAFPAVLVAGTKGKGSTAAMLAAMATAAGWRVGLYTKPHLVDLCERFQVDGRWLPPETVAALVARVQAAVEAGAGGPGWPPSYFEAAAATAFLACAQARVDLGVIEVGIGGRLDATNVLDPRLAVITTIDYDHTEIVGTRLAQIAAEDAGIMRPGRTVVTVPQAPAAARVLAATAARVGARLVRVGHDVHYRTRRIGRDGTVVDVRGRRGRYAALHVPLLGRHQALNAACAVAAAEVLAEEGVAIGETAMRAGLAGLRWPARVEVVRDAPAVVIDVAHNVVSFRALRRVLDDVFPGRRVHLVIGLLGSKDLAGIARVIAPRTAAVWAVRADDPRALAPEAVAAAFRPQVADVRVVDDPVAAAGAAIAAAAPDDVVCVAGSFHVAGPVRASLVGPGRPAPQVTAAVSGA